MPAMSVACSGIMNGLAGLDAGPDWRGPLADRMLISSADGGNSINDAVRQAYYLAGLGCGLAGEPAPAAPKNGAMFHFSLPGSVQGFRVAEEAADISLKNAGLGTSRALAVNYLLKEAGHGGVVTTPVFAPREVLVMRTYELMASPLVYPGQKVRARLIAPEENIGVIDARLCVRVYDGADALRQVDGPAGRLEPGVERVFDWVLPDFDGQPIGEIGIAFSTEGNSAHGRLLLDYLGWDGVPTLNLGRPPEGGNFWLRAWVNGADMFVAAPSAAFRVVQNRGEGLVAQGTRHWTDYRVACVLTIALGNYGGVALRVQGLRRYYGIRVTRTGQASDRASAR